MFESTAVMPVLTFDRIQVMRIQMSFPNNFYIMLLLQGSQTQIGYWPDADPTSIERGPTGWR